MPVILVRTPLGARLVLLGVAALVVRLVYILVIARAPVGVGGDAGFYHSAANQIAHGHFLYRVIFGRAYVTAEHPPLFPLALSLVSLLGGTSLLAHRIAGCVIGSVAVVLIALLGRRVGGSRAGWLAGAVAAMYPPLVTADGLVMSEPLFVLLVAFALLVAVRLRRLPGLGGATVLGLVLGAATLTRGEGLLLLPLLGWPAAFRRPAAPGREVLPELPHRRWQRVAAVTAACALVLAPWVVRNAAVFGRPLLAADSDTVIAGANCPDTYYGHDIGWWSLRCEERARTPLQLRQGDASTTAALRFAGHHLARLPLVAAVRVLRTFDLFQPLRQGNLEPRRKWVDISSLAFVYPVLLLAAFGFVRRRCFRWELLAPVVMVVIVSALGWGIGRFRVAADVSLLVSAAAVLTPSGAPPDRDPAAGPRSLSSSTA